MRTYERACDWCGRVTWSFEADGEQGPLDAAPAVALCHHCGSAITGKRSVTLAILRENVLRRIDEHERRGSE